MAQYIRDITMIFLWGFLKWRCRTKSPWVSIPGWSHDLVDFTCYSDSATFHTLIVTPGDRTQQKIMGSLMIFYDWHMNLSSEWRPSQHIPTKLTMAIHGICGIWADGLAALVSNLFLGRSSPLAWWRSRADPVHIGVATCGVFRCFSMFSP